MSDTSGPAFPSRGGLVIYIDDEHREAVKDAVNKACGHLDGMTLRDYFAGQALIGILGARNGFLTHNGVTAGEWAYRAADAMLAARDKPADDDFVNDDLLAACEDFRDSVLHGRHHLESVLDNDQTNAVLGLYDDTIGAAVAKAKGAR